MGQDIAIIEQNLTALAPRFADVLGTTMPPERLIRTIVVSCERLPALLNCDRQSLFNAAMSAACLGLEVDGVTGQAYLIPFAGKAQLVIGYKGFNTLAARSGITISGEVVRDGDAFDFDEAEGWVKHKKLLGKPGRRIIAAWAKAAANGRPAVVKVLDIDDLMEVKAKSPGAKRNDSPWNDPKIGFPAMCEKTVKRRLARSMPLNAMQLAAVLDEAVDERGRHARITPDAGVIIDGEFAEASPQPTAAQLTTPSPTVTTATKAAPLSNPQTPSPEGGAAEELTGTLKEIDDALAAAANKGTDALADEWRATHKRYQDQLLTRLRAVHKVTAEMVDKGAT